MKQKLEIEVEVPDGYVAIDYRQPEVGELFLLSDGTGVFRHGLAVDEIQAIGPRVILAKDEPLPVPTLKKGCWVAKDKYGCVFAYNTEPICDEEEWLCNGAALNGLNPKIFDLSPLDNVPWDKSLRQVR